MSKKESPKENQALDKNKKIENTALMIEMKKNFKEDEQTQ